MRQEIEIEFKNLLTKEEFEALLHGCPFPEAYKQINYYFETKDMRLSKLKTALRIREKKGQFTLTLKEAKEGHILETHISLTEEEAKQCIDGEFLDREDFSRHLSSLSIQVEDLIYQGKLTSLRRSFSKDNKLYVLDHSFYNGLEDYEFELEADHAEEGEASFHELLKSYQISLKKTPSKIERFFTSLKA